MLAQLKVVHLAPNRVCVTAYLNLDIETKATGRGRATANLIRQAREGGKPFGGEIVLVEEEINKRTFDDRFRLLKSALVEIGQFAFIDCADPRHGRRAAPDAG